MNYPQGYKIYFLLMSVVLGALWRLIYMVDQ